MTTTEIPSEIAVQSDTGRRLPGQNGNPLPEAILRRMMERALRRKAAEYGGPELWDWGNAVFTYVEPDHARLTARRLP